MNDPETNRPPRIDPLEEFAQATDERLLKIEEVVSSLSHSSTESLHEARRNGLVLDEIRKLLSGEREARIALEKRLDRLEAFQELRPVNGR